LVLFFTLDPYLDAAIGTLRVWGMPTFHLDDMWPTVTGNALVSFMLYLLVFDFFSYWFHRAQHQINWWWQLHSLHHAQRQMTMWSDNRNHLLDDLIRGSYNGGKPPRGKSPHERWLYALASEDGLVEGYPDVLERISKQVRQWRRPWSSGPACRRRCKSAGASGH
jgi:hypothetical protein